jgi:hypothetical protein
VPVDLVPTDPSPPPPPFTDPSPPPPPFPIFLPDKDNVYPDYLYQIVVIVLNALTGWAFDAEIVSVNLNIRDPLTNRIIPVDDDLLDYARRFLRDASHTRSWTQLILLIIRPVLPPSVNFLLSGAYRAFLSSTQYLTDLVDVQGGLYYTTSALASFLG